MYFWFFFTCLARVFGGWKHLPRPHTQIHTHAFTNDNPKKKTPTYIHIYTFPNDNQKPDLEEVVEVVGEHLKDEALVAAVDELRREPHDVVLVAGVLRLLLMGGWLVGWLVACLGDGGGALQQGVGWEG